MSSKFDHVRNASQTRGHGCHWPGCEAQCPPAKWGCSRHWFTLPQAIRDRIWQAYRAGQEEDLRPSESYFEAARAAQDWIADYLSKQEPDNGPKQASLL